MSKRIAIVGAGFSGTLTALHLLERSQGKINLFIFGEKENFSKGIAFNPYSKKHLLNVAASRMSAFHDQPSHFLDWVLQQPGYENMDRELVGGSFLPRYLYGNYLAGIWEKTFSKFKDSIHIVHEPVTNLERNEKEIFILCGNEKIAVDYCILANGNSVPGNPRIQNTAFYESPAYFQNPWLRHSVTDTDNALPVLIVGNGLTMVDTVIGLRENGFTNTIYSVSPNGFNILPHRHPGLAYKGLTNELNEKTSLAELVTLVNKHIKLVRSFGASAEPVIDSLRPHTQRIWMSLTDAEKKIFLARLRHLWGVARHRIPTHMHDMLQHMRIEGKLVIAAGRLQNLEQKEHSVLVMYAKSKTSEMQTLHVGRVINCTGPESNISKMQDCFLKGPLEKGIVAQDKFYLGINAHPETFALLGRDGSLQQNLFTLGSNLRGVFWESTAVSELRVQAQQLADRIADFEC